MEVDIIQIQRELAGIYGPEHYYSQKYMAEELKYSGQIQEWMKNRLPPLGPQARILDIGPGYGTLAAWAGILTGAFPMTIDRNQYMTPDVLDEFDILSLTGDIERQDIPADDLDAVIMTEVLEHFNFKALPTMTKIRKAMRPGALLFLSTPDALSQWGKVTKYKKIEDIPEFDPSKNTYDNPEWMDCHIWQYAWNEINDLLIGAGFKIEIIDFSLSPGGIHFNILAEV